MARKLIIGNWKMNATTALAQELAAGALAAAHDEAQVVLCPAFVHVPVVAAMVRGTDVAVGAQDVTVATKSGGAQTGDISAPMLHDVGATYVICGHSERRAQHGEGNDQVRAKAAAVLAAGMTPIICVGETAADREGAREFDVVKTDLLASLPDGVDPAAVIVAYEPVWAISAGDANKPPAKMEDIVAMMSYMRKTLAESLANSDALRMLYGASVKPENATAILTAPHVDGVLVGGAALKADAFAAIIAAARV